MGSAKKFKDHYPPDEKSQSDKGNDNSLNSIEDKRLIEAYMKKIAKLLEDDPEMQKKAALIISDMIKNSNKK